MGESHTASIDWCEENYAYSPYIAEFWNWLTSLIMAVMGISIAVFYARIPFRFFVGAMLLVLVGFGSAAFHGTLSYEGQAMDEIFMFYGIVAYLMPIIGTSSLQYT